MAKSHETLGKMLLTKMDVDTTDMSAQEFDLLGKAIMETSQEFLQNAVAVDPDDQDEVETGEGDSEDDKVKFSDGSKLDVKPITNTKVTELKG